MAEEKIALLTDSCADICKKDLEDNQIYVVPLRILCSDGEYYDGVNITADDIYNRLKSGELPKTSLPSMVSINEVLDRITSQGYRKIIAVMLSGGLSGTYNLVRMAAEERNDIEIVVFDSMSGSLGQGMMILQLAEDIRNGMNWDELVNKRMPFLIKNTFPFFSVDTLEYLQKGGRIGKVTAIAGTLLGIKPIISFDNEDGELKSVAKVRGSKQIKDKLLELVMKSKGEGRNYNLAVANGGAREAMSIFEKMVAAALPEFKKFWKGEIDGTLSTYIGKGVLGAAVQLLY